MKSEKAKEYITHATCTAQEYAERFGGRELVVSRWDVSTAIELAEQDADLLRRDMRDKFYYAMWNWIRRYWRNIGKAKDIAPQTAAAYERALDKQVEEVADLKYRLSSLTQWRDIQADPKWGFATDDAIDEIFRNLPRLVRDKRDGSIELIDYDNAAEWRGDLERKPSLYQWLPINGNTL